MVKQQKTVIQFSLMTLMSALVTVGTLIVQIPNGLGGYFNGLMDDVAIYSRALTAEEIKLHYDSGNGWRGSGYCGK